MLVSYLDLKCASAVGRFLDIFLILNVQTRDRKEKEKISNASGSCKIVNQGEIIVKQK